MRIVITGSSSGIGQVMAERLLRQGHAVWGLARRAHSFDLSHLGSGAAFRCSRIDVASWTATAQAASEIAHEWNGIDALITCAARQGEIGPTAAINPFDWGQTIRVTLGGTFNSIRAFFPLLGQAARRAKVICFSGGGATGPRPNFSAYAAAKAGVVRLTETLAVEWRDLPIDINAVAPGAVPTSMTEEVLVAGQRLSGVKDYQAAQETRRGGREAFEPICSLVDYLLSETSDGMVGRLISAQWDNWRGLTDHRQELMSSDVFTLRRIIPKDRGFDF